MTFSIFLFTRVLVFIKKVEWPRPCWLSSFHPPEYTSLLAYWWVPFLWCWLFPSSDVLLFIVIITNTLAMTFVIYPFTSEHISVCILVGAFSVMFVVYPFLPRVLLFIGILVGALALGVVLIQFTKGFVSIGKGTGALAMMIPFFPFARVLISIVILECA